MLTFAAVTISAIAATPDNALLLILFITFFIFDMLKCPPFVLWAQYIISYMQKRQSVTDCGLSVILCYI